MWMTLAEHLYERLYSIWERLECEDLIVLEDRHGSVSISDIYETARGESQIRLLYQLGEDEWCRDERYRSLAEMRDDRADHIELARRDEHIEHREPDSSPSKSDRTRHLASIYRYRYDGG